MKKVVLITGATGGIGLALTKSLSAAGWTVAGMARTPRGEYALYGSLHQGDVSYPADCQNVFDQVLSAHGQVDALIHCAAVAGPEEPLSWQDSSLWVRTLQVNVAGTVNMCRAVLPHMVSRGSGRILTFSGGGVGGSGLAPRRTAYVASKAALVTFTEALSLELPPTVQVNAVAPGRVSVGMSEGEPYGVLEGEAYGAPSPNTGKLEALVRWLLSEQCEWTGRLFAADWDEPWKWVRGGVAGADFPFSETAHGDWCRLRRETFGGAT